MVTHKEPLCGVTWEVVASPEDRFEAAFEMGIERLAAAVARAAQHEQCWLERVRAGLVALLGFLDDEPQWGRLLLTDAPVALEPECTQRLHRVLGELLDEGPGYELTEARPIPARRLTSELVLGGVFSVIREQMLDPDSVQLVELAPSLMPFLVAPYVASAELAAVPASDRVGPMTAVHPRPDLPIRVTHRTTRVLGAIETVPGASNREIADAAGLADEGQTSRLLARLERRGLIENIGLGQSRGEPNAWLLTSYGQRVVKSIGHGFAMAAAGPGPPRGGGNA